MLTLHPVCIKRNKSDQKLIMSLYVDDLVYVGNKSEMFVEFNHVQILLRNERLCTYVLFFWHISTPAT